MSETEKRTYEGMFLLEAGQGDFNTASEPVRTALEKNDAEILAIKPWDERRLAYQIRGRRRGLYVLTYFKAPPERIAELERDCTLDERILRLLVIRRDNLTEEIIQADTPATISARRAAARKAEQPGAKPTSGQRRKKAESKPAESKPAEAAGAAASDETSSTGTAPAQMPAGERDEQKP
ncbi:MAG: 30S ribosomal protein S6, partial [Planctomycetes bacterium]|nr:30S ribosomal protein S6 [Planctomycetota bacterium]